MVIADRDVRRSGSSRSRSRASLWLSLLVLPFVGAGMMVEMASTNTILQTIVERATARPRDGVLHDGVSRHRADRQPARRLRRRTASGRCARSLPAGSPASSARIVFGVRLPKLRAHVRPIYIERGILAAAEIEGGSKSL